MPPLYQMTYVEKHSPYQVPETHMMHLDTFTANGDNSSKVRQKFFNGESYGAHVCLTMSHCARVPTLDSIRPVVYSFEFSHLDMQENNVQEGWLYSDHIVPGLKK